MKKKSSLFFLFLYLSIGIGCGGVSFAQNSNIDSLLTLLKTDKPDTSKVNHLIKLTSEYINSREYNCALKYANKSLALARSVAIKNKRGWGKGIAKAYNNIGIIYNAKGNYELALKNHFEALKIREGIEDKQGIAVSYNNIGTTYKNQGNYSRALKKYSDALKIRKEIGDKNEISNLYGRIGNIYYFQGNYPEALKNHFASLRIMEKLDNKQGIATCYNNIGGTYQSQGNHAEALKSHSASLKISEDIKDIHSIANSYNNIGIIYKNQGDYSQALKKYNASLKIYESIKDKLGIAALYNNIGGIYEDIDNYPKALENHLKSVKLRENIGDKEGIATSFANLGAVYTKLKKLKTAEDYLNRALQISREIGNKEMIRDTYMCMATLDSTQRNWKEAYSHHKLFIIYRDSIDNEETRKRTTEIILTNKFEKQEAATKAEQDKKDTIATTNKKKQQLILILVSCVLIFVFVFAGFVVRSLRITRKQKSIIEFQKDEVSHQKEIVLKKNKEITDSINYAQRIQRALLASNTMLDANLISSHSEPPNSPKSPKQVRDRQVRDRQVQQDRDYFIFFQPKDIVSGDFYWASSLANGNFALVTADSTGHGVPGAIMSMLNISCLNEAVKGQQLTEPNEILNYTRNKIIEHLSNDGSADGGKDGMDCSLISFEFDDLKLENGKKISDSQNLTKLTYSAANNPIWIVKSAKQGKPDANDVSELIELKPDKMPVGKHEKDKIPFTQQTIELQRGDIVYTLTDGMPDQFGGSKGKKFMARQLKELIISICHLPMNEQKEKLADAFNLWKGDLEQVDDVCIIGVKI